MSDKVKTLLAEIEDNVQQVAECLLMIQDHIDDIIDDFERVPVMWVQTSGARGRLAEIELAIQELKVELGTSK